MSGVREESAGRVAEGWARAFAGREPLRTEEAVVAEVGRLHGLGLLALPAAGPEFHHDVLDALAWVGYGSLPLGRLLEGHWNALLLVKRFGTAAQWEAAARLVGEGVLFGVWNTGEAAVVRLERGPGASVTMRGRKTFGSGASFVRRPIVTGEVAGEGWQMTLVAMERALLAVDREPWKPMGMEASFSFDVDFSGTVLEAADLIGGPGDFYREPAFSGGAVRFAAVHAGGARRLVDEFTEWLRSRDRGGDPHQAMRLSQCVQRMQESLLWVRFAAEEAEALFDKDDPASAARMVQAADMTRTAVERNATEIMRLVSVGVGAHGLLEPHAFGPVMRDLTMYLRQPAPDRIALRIAEFHLERDTFAGEGLIEGPEEPLKAEGRAEPALRAEPGPPAIAEEAKVEAEAKRTLTQRYFDEVYAANRDPWGFETSAYEAEKYASSLRILPAARYARALEIGCSIGVFTRLLAERCERLLAVDVAEQALAEARSRCADRPQVMLARMHVPDEFPEGEFDLVTVCEVGYYWSEEDLRLACRRIAEHQREGADLLLVHWTPEVPDYPLRGEAVHEMWLSQPWWQAVAGRRQATYRMDVLRRNGVAVG